MARDLVVRIVGDATSLERAFKKSERAAKGFQGDMSRTQTRSQRAFGGIRRSALGLAGAFVGTAGLAAGIRVAFNEFSEAQKVNAQLGAALKSTGGAANVTAKQIDELADAMLKKTGIDDEAIKTADAMLLSFTNVRNEVGKGNDIFNRATGAIADLATGMAGGAVPSAEQMQTAAIQLGKALNDPIAGLGSLSRIGIRFTDQQKDQIKTLVESGHTMEAQKLILGELNKEMGGRAAAAGKTFAGQWKILTETLNNLAGTLLGKLMPTIQKYLEMAVKWLSNSKNQKAIIDAVKGAAEILVGTVNTLKGAFDLLAGAVGGSKNAMKLLLGFFIVWKGLKLVGYVNGIAKAMGLLAANTARANAASTSGTFAGGPLGGGKAGKVAKAGRFARLGRGILGAVGPLVAIPAGIELSNQIRKLPGWEKHFRGRGGLAISQLTGIGMDRPMRPGAFAAVGSAIAGRPLVVHTHVHLDGREVATSTTRHQQHKGRGTGRSRRGNHGGLVLGVG